MSANAERVLLVTAHPDDECMFFTPSIRNFISKGISVDLLCLSTGNYDEMGRRRRKELEKAAGILGISSTFIIDDEELKDGPKSVWKPETIYKYLVDKERERYTIILTFDERGVSGHSNHCSVSKALADDERCWMLKSLPLWLKYLGPLGSMISSFLYKDENVYKISLFDAFKYGYFAMTQHESQMVWFRRLYLIFSVYMTVNILSRKRQ